ncbi:MAG TPA: tetratricopeptide repeat-containing sensor histidine kinase [Gelidibacter sp.]|uniref:tetratricopeptide repeat-containing sensor histidine kinase n=1 Tax=Gelidibacter sp. TaxID=2018083 RepID=UPI002CC0FDC5|nr:tetratricopeptide repeat-containing sensor histidine kinase [Gelidibacter sp.]HXJ97301.1 tetratricopeptide repeat-containing sensor histidine kinase [Gelidibacter sp.]
MKRLIVLAAFFAIFSGHSQTKKIDSLSVQLAYQNQDTSKVDTSIQLIKALYKAKEYQKALLYISETDQLSSSLNYPKGVAEANYYKALIYAGRNDYYNAMDHFDKSKKLYVELKDAVGIANVSNQIGMIEINRGNYAAGLTNSLAAIKIFEDKNLYEDLSVAYNNLAEAYSKTHQIDKALEFNIKALTIRERFQDSSGIKISTKNIARLYSERKEHRKAIEYYEAVLGMIDPKTDQALRGEVLPRIGEEYLKFKDYDKAAEYLVQGLKYNRKTNDKEGLLRALNSISHLNLDKNNLKLAENQIYEAHDLAKKIGNSEELLKNYKLLMALDSTKGKFQNAYKWQREYFTLKQQLERENQPKLPTNTDSIEESIVIDLPVENQILPAEEPATNTNQVKNLKLLSYGLIVAFLIVLTFLLLIYQKRKSTIKYTEELKNKNIQIQLQNDAILEQKLNLEEINSVKDRLFSIVSHDLKDSISSIKGFLDLLKEGSISNQEFDELIPELSENANNASLLLFNLLNWSKSQMQNLESNPETFNIQEVFHDKINLVEQKIDQKRIVIIDESQREFVYADKSMVEIIIQNLITNAIKFSRVGDIITISNKTHNGKSLICVEDTGVGISKENLGKLFKNNNFTTIGTKNEKGTGLGLTICKELVELNHGRIWVESTENVGSKFYVELPKTKTEAK